MAKKIAFFLAVILIIQFIPVPSASGNLSFSDLVASSAVLAEKDTGTILYQFNMNARHPADGLVKIMTLLLAAYAVENDVVSDNELITMTEAAWIGLSEDSSTLGIEPGEEMTFIDLMYAAYLGNASEACNMIAIRIAGSIPAFVNMMNDQVQEFGCTDTRFANAHGEYHSSQYTTAHDQFIIFSEAMRNALFAEVSGTFRHVTESIDETESRTISSSNYLINRNSRYFYRSCISGRDSATFEGGYSLVAYAEEDGLSLVSVILGSNVHMFEDESTEIRSFSETLRLFQWGYTQFAWRDILRTTDLLARVPVLHGSGADFVNARPDTPLTLLLENSIPVDEFERNIVIYSERDEEPLVAPISSGETLGEVVITRNGVEYGRRTLVANTEVKLSGVEYMRGQISEMLSTSTARNIILILVLLVVIYIALVIRYNVVRANRLRRIKNAKKDIIRERHQNFRD